MKKLKASSSAEDPIEIESPKLGPCKPILSYYQQQIVDRVVRDCRNQFGHLLFHKMGSGKTITALSILNNLPGAPHKPGDRRKIVIAPGSIITSSYEASARDVGLVFGSNADRARDTYDLMTYDRRAGYMSIAELLANGTLKEALRDKIVVADEAHSLLPFFTSDLAETLIDAFHAAKRVVLMTGSPILKGPWNLTALLSLAVRDPKSPLPWDRAMFRAIYYKSKGSGPIAWDNFKTFLPVLVGLVVPGYSLLGKALRDNIGKLLDMPEVQQCITVCESAIATSPSSDLTTFMNTISTALSSISSENVFAAAIASAIVTLGVTLFANAAAITLKISDYDVLAEDKFLAATKNYISFFDYETSEPPVGQMPPSLSFPRKEIVDCLVAYTTKQNQLLYRYASKDTAYGLTARELAALDIRTIGPDLSKEEYVFHSRKIGNYSDDMISLKTVMGPNGQYESVPRKDDAFACPRFETCLKLLLQCRTSEGYEMDNNFYVKRGPYLLRSKKNFLPLVYSSFDKQGLRIFSSYLTSRGHAHIIFMDNDDPATRQAKLQLVARTQYLPYTRGEPLCALLHPSIQAGLDLPFNPLIVVLEPVLDYGNQEQVYARILRRFGKSFSDDLQRVLKTVIQMECRDTSNTVDIDSMGRVQIQAASKLQSAQQYVKSMWTFARETQGRGFYGLSDRYHVYGYEPELLMLQDNQVSENALEVLSKLLSKETDPIASKRCRGDGPLSCTVCPSGMCDCGPSSCAMKPLQGGKQRSKRSRKIRRTRKIRKVSREHSRKVSRKQRH